MKKITTVISIVCLLASANSEKLFAQAGGTTGNWNLRGNTTTNASTNFMGTIDSVDVNLRTHNINRITIKGNGNIGIGKTPTTKLDVNGGIKGTGINVTGTVVANGGTSTNWNLAFGWGNHATQGYLKTESDPQVGINTTNYVSKWDGTALSSSNIYTNGTFTGINTTTSIGSGSFTVQSPNTSGYGGMYLNQNGTNCLPFYGYAVNGGSSVWTYLNQANGNWNVYNNGDRLTIANTGKVGIGTTTPIAKLHVFGGDAYINAVNVGNGAGGFYSNTVLGGETMMANTGNNSSTAIGYQVLKQNTTGNNNSALGSGAMYFNTTGSFNTALGVQALLSNLNGTANTAAGFFSLAGNTTGSANTAFGEQSLKNNSTGFQNTSVGKNTMVNTTTGAYNTALGYNTGPSGSTLFNTTCVGIDATATASNSVRLGNTFVTSIGGQVGWTTLSDGRFKQNVKEDVPGLDFINKLRPVTYQVNREAIDNYTGVSASRANGGESNGKSLSGEKMSEVTTGFIAQEVEKAANEVGFNFSGVDKPKNDKDYYGLRYDEFTVPLVKSVQELSKQLTSKDDQINELQAQVSMLMEQMKKIQNCVAQQCPDVLEENANAKLINAETTKLTLDQNSPNPFSIQTTISYSLPATVSNATINVFSINGQMIKSFQINSGGNGQVILDAQNLESGSYQYVLIVDGKKVDSKTMMIVR